MTRFKEKRVQTIRTPVYTNSRFKNMYSSKNLSTDTRNNFWVCLMYISFVVNTCCVAYNMFSITRNVFVY